MKWVFIIEDVFAGRRGTTIQAEIHEIPSPDGLIEDSAKWHFLNRINGSCLLHQALPFDKWGGVVDKTS